MLSIHYQVSYSDDLGKTRLTLDHLAVDIENSNPSGATAIVATSEATNERPCRTCMLADVHNPQRFYGKEASTTRPYHTFDTSSTVRRWPHGIGKIGTQHN